MLMAEARRSDQWDHTALLAAITANPHRGKRRPFTPKDFHPLPSRRREAPVVREKVKISELRNLFV